MTGPGFPPVDSGLLQGKYKDPLGSFLFNHFSFFAQCFNLFSLHFYIPSFHLATLIKKKFVFLSSGRPKLWPVRRPQNPLFFRLSSFFDKEIMIFLTQNKLTKNEQNNSQSAVICSPGGSTGNYFFLRMASVSYTLIFNFSPFLIVPIFFLIYLQAWYPLIFPYIFPTCPAIYLFALTALLVSMATCMCVGGGVMVM